MCNYFKVAFVEILGDICLAIINSIFSFQYVARLRLPFKNFCGADYNCSSLDLSFTLS